MQLTNGTSNLDSTPVQQTGVVKCLADPVTTFVTKTSEISSNGEQPTSTSNKRSDTDSGGSTISDVFTTRPTDTSTLSGTATPTDTSNGAESSTGLTLTMTPTNPIATTTLPMTTTVATNRDPGSQPRTGNDFESSVTKGPSDTSLEGAPTTTGTFAATTTVNVCAPPTHS